MGKPCAPRLACEVANLLLISLVLVATSSGAENGGARARYVLKYPAADAFCVPVRAYAQDVVETVMEVNGGLVEHVPNGGYGLAIVTKVQGQNLLHLGADVAWIRPGEPVFAIANGVVRISQGTDRAKKPKQTPPRAGHGATEWGNLIVIEHRLADGSFMNSIYGHLSKKRLVQDGDIVRAGQAIGTVGRAGVENGGYKPHLHFGIREGRRFENGDTLLSIHVQDESFPLRVVNLGETEIEIAADRPLPAGVQLPGKVFEIQNREGKYYVSADLLEKLQNPNFAIVGYGLSTKGWRDPTEFLREKNAVQPPAP